MAGPARLLLNGLRRRGFTLAWVYDPAAGGHAMEVVAPAGSALSDADRAALARHREAVVDLLWQERFGEDDGGDRVRF